MISASLYNFKSNIVPKIHYDVKDKAEKTNVNTGTDYLGIRE